jgi:hypothetical protein
MLVAARKFIFLFIFTKKIQFVKPIVGIPVLYQYSSSVRLWRAATACAMKSVD